MALRHAKTSIKTLEWKGILSVQEKGELNTQIKTRQAILLAEEVEWHLKIKTLWVKEGDNNTKSFHTFSNHRRSVNTIWKLTNEIGNNVSSYEQKEQMCVCFFSSLLIESPR